MELVWVGTAILGWLGVGPCIPGGLGLGPMLLVPSGGLPEDGEVGRFLAEVGPTLPSTFGLAGGTPLG
jgi:hypothetical protein